MDCFNDQSPEWGDTVQGFVAEFVKNFDTFRMPVESLDDFRYVISDNRRLSPTAKVCRPDRD